MSIYCVANGLQKLCVHTDTLLPEIHWRGHCNAFKLELYSPVSSVSLPNPNNVSLQGLAFFLDGFPSRLLWQELDIYQWNWAFFSFSLKVQRWLLTRDQALQSFSFLSLQRKFMHSYVLLRHVCIFKSPALEFSLFSNDIHLLYSLTTFQ